MKFLPRHARMPALFAAIAISSLAGGMPAAPVVREAGAIYLSDFDTKPMKLKVLQAAPAYFDISGTRYVGTLRIPQVVEVQAISDHAYRVRGNAQQGQVLGWIEPKFLQPIPPETLTALVKSEERRKTVAELIAKNQVAIGMTPGEVEQSVGRPQKKSARASKDKSPEETWDYVKYATIPQNTSVAGPGGVYTIVTTYIKKPIGQLTINFKEGLVESLDQSEGTIFTGNETTIVTPPVVVYW